MTTAYFQLELQVAPATQTCLLTSSNILELHSALHHHRRRLRLHLRLHTKNRLLLVSTRSLLITTLGPVAVLRCIKTSRYDPLNYVRWAATNDLLKVLPRWLELNRGIRLTEFSTRTFPSTSRRHDLVHHHRVCRSFSSLSMITLPTIYALGPKKPPLRQVGQYCLYTRTLGSRAAFFISQPRRHLENKTNWLTWTLK